MAKKAQSAPTDPVSAAHLSRVRRETELLGANQVECPVCAFPASPVTCVDRPGRRYHHRYRLFPCYSETVVLTPVETLEAIPDVRWW